MIEALSILIEQAGAVIATVLRFVARLPAHLGWLVGAPARLWRRAQAIRARLAIVLAGHLTLSRVLAGAALFAALLGLLVLPAALLSLPLALPVLLFGPRMAVDPLPRRLSGVALVVGGLLSGWFGLLAGITWAALTA